MNRIVGMPLSALLALLAGCHGRQLIPDDRSAYYGPVIRTMSGVPGVVYEALCRNRGTPCMADPGRDTTWSGSFLGGKPTEQLIWTRRMGRFYVVHHIQNEENISTGFDVYDEATSANLWRTDDYQFANGRLPPPPAGLDARIVQMVNHVYATESSCAWSSNPQDVRPEECGHWPLR